MFNVGFGATEEEAAEAKRREKNAHVPCSDMDVPADIAPDQFDALLLERIECIMHDVAELNAIVTKAPSDVIDEYLESVQSSLTAIWDPIDDLWQSLHDESDLGPAGGSLSGWLIRRQRLGQEMKWEIRVQAAQVLGTTPARLAIYRSEASRGDLDLLSAGILS